MEHGSIEREIHIEAPPQVVFDVVSRPEHIREWWPDDAELDPTPGSVGQVVFGTGQDAFPVPLTVVEVDPPRRFAFRWSHPRDEAASASNSLLVTLDLVPADGGTTLRLTETGFREQGWEVAVLEQAYAEHVQGWDHFLPRLQTYAARVGVR